MFFNARHVFRTDVDGLVVNGDGLEFLDRGKGFADVSFVAFRIRGGHRYKHMQTRFLGFLQRFKPLAGTRGFGFVNARQAVIQRRQAHPKHQPITKSLEQVKMFFGQWTAGEDANVERAFITNGNQRLFNHRKSCVVEQLGFRECAAVEHLVRIGSAAKYDGPVAVLLELFFWRVLCGFERGQELIFIPRPQQRVTAPLLVWIIYAVFFQFGRLLVGGRRGDVAEPAGVAASDGNIESPVRERFVFEIVDGDGSRLLPEVERLFAGFGHDQITMVFLPGHGKLKNQRHQLALATNRLSCQCHQCHQCHKSKLMGRSSGLKAGGVGTGVGGVLLV